MVNAQRRCAGVAIVVVVEEFREVAGDNGNHVNNATRIIDKRSDIRASASAPQRTTTNQG